jgi:hypothetical protein
MDKSYSHSIIAMFYFSFTSLSTVGFGDFNPKSDAERVLCAFALMGGVAIFSIVMGNFSEMILEFTTFNAELEEEEKLSQFFDVIKYKNGGKMLPLLFIERINQYFYYRWSHDRN